MKIEHVAFNVEKPVETAQWYIEYFGMSIAKKEEDPPYTHFLTDSSGDVMIEIYNNPADQVPDYRSMDPLLLHLAFVSEDPGKEKQRLLEAGATLVSDEVLPDGSHLVMLRDPWGLAIQLCKRANPML
ncbi:VOC family protein [Aliifodinibius sp. S!AR15-10]|uniref:VOC family protein n=1 Tax=Aliifodinibius sp. S!AR15-10 TaxID=2950437 RepID=UPI0028587EA7|nr:VOC family protein [Aliifodinibius sp. S!AR15-10]MDR8392875.1 VOC family protein [Aliifodinibius sp. S!AR15-10]